MSTASPLPTLSPEDTARTERARRIAIMLDRWEKEDCADEPEWDVEDITPVRLRQAAVDADDQGGSK